MPGPASHLFIADKVSESFSTFTDFDVKKLTSGINEKYYKMGSTGPDLWFFAPDYPINRYMEILLVYGRDIVQPIREFYEDTIEPVVENIEEVSEVADVFLDKATCNNISNIKSRVGHILETLGGLRDSYIAHVFTESVNTFDLMRAEAQEGKDEVDWFWFDILHSRRTGQFLKTMWSKCTTDKQRAYVLGYATHVAADVSGHPYINQVVGGPGRSHNQRHHFVENILDVWFYDHEITPPVIITKSKLHQQLPYGDELDDEGILFAVMDGVVESKDDLIEVFTMVSDAMHDTFPESERPIKDKHPDGITTALPDGITTANDINLAYWLLIASFKISTDSYIPKPAAPLEGVLDSITEAMEEFLSTVTHPPIPPSAPPDPCYALWDSNCDLSLDALQVWLEYLWDNIVYLSELINWAASVLNELFDVLVCTITAPFKVAVSSLLWIIQSSLHSLLEELRHCLALASFVHPESNWVNSNPIPREIIELSERSHDDLIKEQYPHRAQESNDGFLAYPKTTLEGEATVAGPYPVGSTPSSILTGIGTTNVDGGNLYSQYAATQIPKDLRDLEFDNVEKQTFPAIALARKLFRELMSDEDIVIPDWNLDADRGYQYKNWQADWGNLLWNKSENVDESWDL